MKRAIARKWIQALESGEYKQTQGQLRKAGRFCCLGVLCNLHAQEHPEMAATQKKATEYFDHAQFLPKEVWDKWAGMRGGHSLITSLNDDLAHMNDSGKSFAEIAKVIRKHWKEL